MPRQKHKERKVCLPSRIVSSVMKLLTFLVTIVLQLQIDFAFGGWKIASALLRSLTRKTLPELCLVPPKAPLAPRISPPLATPPSTKQEYYTKNLATRV